MTAAQSAPRLERTLDRASYRSVPEVMSRYGVRFCQLYRWRACPEPRFPAAIKVKIGHQQRPFFRFLGLVRWEIAKERSARRRRVLQ